MDSTTVTQPLNADVLLGSSDTAPEHHPGNRTFRNLIKLNRNVYATCPEDRKSRVAGIVVSTICDRGGRFLEKQAEESTTVMTCWTVASQDRAVELTSLALQAEVVAANKQNVRATTTKPEWEVSPTSKSKITALSNRRKKRNAPTTTCSAHDETTSRLEFSAPPPVRNLHRKMSDSVLLTIKRPLHHIPQLMSNDEDFPTTRSRKRARSSFTCISEMPMDLFEPIQIPHDCSSDDFGNVDLVELAHLAQTAADATEVPESPSCGPTVDDILASVLSPSELEEFMSMDVDSDSTVTPEAETEKEEVAQSFVDTIRNLNKFQSSARTCLKSSSRAKRQC